jgi:hypothetical protein
VLYYFTSTKVLAFLVQKCMLYQDKSTKTSRGCPDTINAKQVCFFTSALLVQKYKNSQKTDAQQSPRSQLHSTRYFELPRTPRTECFTSTKVQILSKSDARERTLKYSTRYFELPRTPRTAAPASSAASSAASSRTNEPLTSLQVLSLLALLLHQ